jgi:ribosome recycling factor
MIQDVHRESSKKMDQALQAVRKDLGAVRTGRATVSLFDGVHVQAYGTDLPLNQVATLASPEPSLLTVKPFDPGLIGEIERGILKAGLGLNPSNDGQVVRVPIPQLTEERRKQLSKKVHDIVESGKTAVRNIRREANDQLKALEKAGDAGQDDVRRALDQVQKTTDDHVKTLDQMAAAKVEEIMTV